MRVMGYSYNNVLEETFARLAKTPGVEVIDDARSADHFLLWQDVRGACLTLAEINRSYLQKPLTVVQHGRGAMRDYLPPNSFPALADTLCVWGQAEADYLRRAGLESRTKVTGSPLANHLKGVKRLRTRQEKEGVNVLFVPVITDHEQPENLITYYRLKQIELDHCIERLEAAKDKLKESWHSWHVEPGCVTDGSIPHRVLTSNFRLITKLAQGAHDKPLYQGNILSTHPSNRTHLAETLKLLAYADVVIGMEEGTLQLLAMALDIPVVIVDDFRYHTYAGVDYRTVEMIRTSGAVHTDLAHLRETLDDVLAHPERLRAEREEAVERELCPKGIQDPVAEILDVVTSSSKRSTVQEVSV